MQLPHKSPTETQLTEKVNTAPATVSLQTTVGRATAEHLVFGLAVAIL